MKNRIEKKVSPSIEYSTGGVYFDIGDPDAPLRSLKTRLVVQILERLESVVRRIRLVT
jgi:hypothetical protein